MSGCTSRTTSLKRAMFDLALFHLFAEELGIVLSVRASGQTVGPELRCLVSSFAKGCIGCLGMHCLGYFSF